MAQLEANFSAAKNVLKQWNRCHGPYYQIRETDLRWNLTAQDLLSYRFTTLDGTPIMYAVATEQGEASGLSTKSLWLSLWGEITEGHESRFVSELEALTRAEGKARLTIGADEFHFVPGVPTDSPADLRLIDALEISGYQGATEADFVGDAASTAVTAYITEARGLASNQAMTFRIAETDAERTALHAFLAREFPGRWTREFEFWRSRSDTRRGFWATLQQSGTIMGFARMAVRNRVKGEEMAWCPGALRLPLRRESRPDLHDSCLGPIGVAASGRGKGSGRVLLGLVLEKLREEGAERICIDWTDAFKYYEPLCFEKARQYRTAWKGLSG